MSSLTRWGVARSIVISITIALSVFTFRIDPLRAQPAEIRALWVVRTTLNTPAGIAAMVASAKSGGFNTLIVQVRGRGDAYYLNSAEPRPAALVNQAAFDPLATTISKAHEAGLSVHAWINVNLVAGLDLPASRDHIIYRHPEWLMVPRPLAEDLAVVNPRSPEYLGRLARFVRDDAAELEGLYLSPITAGASQYTLDVVRDIVRRYDVDGVHLDYIRYPSDEFDYSRGALLAFRQDVIPDLPAADRRAYDARMALSPLVYAQTFPERWREFRTARLTALVAQLRATIRAARPKAVISAAVIPDAHDAVTHRLQDWRGWLARDLIDVVCPMAYTTDARVFTSQIAAAREIAGTHGLWAGIGAYRLSTEQIATAVQSARHQGVEGVILFSYDSLADPARGPDYLAQVGRAVFTSQ